MDEILRKYHPKLVTKKILLHQNVSPFCNASNKDMYKHNENVLGLLVVAGTLYDTRQDIFYHPGSFIMEPIDENDASKTNNSLLNLVAVSTDATVLCVPHSCSSISADILAGLIKNSVAL